MSQSIIRDNNNCFNTTNYVNVWDNCTVADDRSELLAWLSPLDPRLRHRDIRERRVDNVGEWLMQTEEFGKWYDRDGEGEGDNAVLFCYGDPGVGKTFISSLVVDRLCDVVGGQDTAVACFYFDFASRKDHTATSMLGSLLKQIVSGIDWVPEEISRVFQAQRKVIGGREPGLPDIVKMLQTVTSSQRTFLCIDAMDECAAVHRVKLLDSLKQIVVKSPHTRIFVTGRPHIRAEIERRLAGRVMSVPAGPRKDDITRYLRVRLSEDETPDAMDESLEEEILRKIPENISEMFLLVSLNIEAILQESTIRRRREKLGRMTDGLGLEDVYGATIERIKAQNGDKSRLGIAALLWVSHAERPLRTDELCHALAVEIGSMDFDSANIPSMSTLVSCCQGLITVDNEASTVRLIHFTLQEYLSGHPDIFNRPHSTMAEICLTYLNSQKVKALSCDPSPITQDTPFLEYCSIYWGVHAKKEPSGCATSLMPELLLGDYGHMSTKLLLMPVDHLDHWTIDTWSPFSGLHCASFFGLSEVVVRLIEMGCGDIDGEDFWGFTPLAWAACNGHVEVMEVLLRLGAADPEIQGGRGWTPLSLAAQNGHEGAVKLLLRQEKVNPDSPDIYGVTPLSYAARRGHESVAEALLGREEVVPDKPDNWGERPLLFAAIGGYEGVAKLLLGREEVDPDAPGSDGGTPLSYAARFGNGGVVELLLGEEKVNPNKPDDDGKTPLSHAALNGHEEVVSILLEQAEVNPDGTDNDSLTPLWLAAENGHVEVVEILLGREGANPESPDNGGQTPLPIAARHGHENVVALLLSRGAGAPV